MEEIIVSVICNAYNHEAYIRDALEGFVKQKTDFPFEVLVHDDASKDSTAEIIREYEEKYPEIIKPIYETENQYSKTDGSLTRIQYGRARGKYIALCEGDDYWTDPQKLQKQVDALECHPEIDICATGAATETEGMLLGEIAPSNRDVVFTPEQVIAGGGGFVATASLMFRKSIHDDPLPFSQMLRLDYSIQIMGSLKGGMLYLADQTCVYRIAAQGSWTSRMTQNIEALNRFQEQLCDMLRCLDQDTSGKYHGVIEQTIADQMFERFVRNQDFKSACLPEYKDRLRKLPFRDRTMIRVKKHFPNAATHVKNLIGRKK